MSLNRTDQPDTSTEGPRCTCQWQVKFGMDERIGTNPACDVHGRPSWDRADRAAAERMYPNHHPDTALANYRAGREVWDSNGDAW